MIATNKLFDDDLCNQSIMKYSQLHERVLTCNVTKTNINHILKYLWFDARIVFQELCKKCSSVWL